jgi:quinoprotein glucose dehydrogenase
MMGDVSRKAGRTGRLLVVLGVPIVLWWMVVSPESRPTAGRDWPVYLGDKASTQYSPLDQIHKGNVARLQVAWTYDTGDQGEFQSNNLIIDGVLYTASPSRNVMALNAATGEELWRFDPRTEHDGNISGRQRGLVYWEDGGEQRLFTAAATWLYALDPRTGRPIRSFGENGSIHMGQQMDLEETPIVGLTTPGLIYKDLLIMGGLVSELTPGAIRAFDVRTGKRRWIFHTIPRPGEYGYETWPPDAWKTVGGASDWSGLALDEERGIVYASTETAGPDFWGGQRFGMNLFANSVIALDANTGRRLWHYQLVHHDLWDLDLPTPPTLLTVTHGGRPIDALAQGTKQGLLFVFDRVTGEPLWPIHERPAPPSEIPGVRTWPTQPFPEKPPPLMRQIYTKDDVSNISPEARALTADRLSRAGAYGAFPPPSWREAIMFPGFDGGFEWGGAAADPDGILYANLNEIPWIYLLVSTRTADGKPLTTGERQYRIHCASCHGVDRAGEPAGGMPSLLDMHESRTRDYVMQVVEHGFGRMPAFGDVPEPQRHAIVDFLFGQEESAPDRRPGKPDAGAEETRQSEAAPPYTFAGFRRWFDQEGYPAIKPPWGTLSAVDLNTGAIKWQVPLGEYPELTARGIPPTGTENYGGPVVTAGGLVFIGATADETFRAFDKDTGRILWQAALPFGGNATPSTYMVNGRQYVVISAGGGKSGRPAGGAIVAFALPD